MKFFQRRNRKLTTHYVCPDCHLEFTQEAEYCPVCKKEGKATRLIPQVMESLN